MLRHFSSLPPKCWAFRGLFAFWFSITRGVYANKNNMQSCLIVRVNIGARDGRNSIYILSWDYLLLSIHCGFFFVLMSSSLSCQFMTYQLVWAELTTEVPVVLWILPFLLKDTPMVTIGSHLCRGWEDIMLTSNHKWLHYLAGSRQLVLQAWVPIPSRTL